ncbi:septum formation initiator [Micromonospora sp. WMMD1102]|uniref:septum formation initiator n=1 Tax=Micromonospora sp. WMMD1102 TaxID=3016105 RepID=UPI0024157F85|nr:septum formation initiator [Micromonospora sp. WMMD1102]MDG4788718.1 septum formation initiator [Micromonospora sp. WMMD1102]
MRRRTLLAVAGWLLAALVATGTGLAAVQVIGAGLTGPAGEVRSPDEVARALAGTPPPAGPGAVPPGAPVPPDGTGSVPLAPPGGTGSASPAPSGGPPTAADGSRRLVVTPGGSVLAECTGQRVWLASWTPAQGYRTGEVERGPDDDAEVTFHGSGGRIEVEVECAAGRPVPTWKSHSGGED